MGESSGGDLHNKSTVLESEDWFLDFCGFQVNDEAFSYYPRLSKVRKYVRQNYSNNISLSDVAGIAGNEPKYFSNFFRIKVGVKFRDWLAFMRVKRAVEILKSADRSITDTAFTVGFSDLRTFQRNFKRFTNMTPREFKRLVRPS